MTQTVHIVRMGMSVCDGEALSELLPRVPDDVAERVMDQLWLKTALTIARKQVPIAERTEFDARADRILELIDPQEKPC